MTRDFRLATWFLVGGAALALAANLIVERRIAPLPAGDRRSGPGVRRAEPAVAPRDILQMKMTIVDGVLGAVLFVGVAAKKKPAQGRPRRSLFSTRFRLAHLALRYGLFWWACAIANEIVRRTLTAEAGRSSGSPLL